MASEFQKYLAAQAAEQQAKLRQLDAEEGLAGHAAQARRYQDMVKRGIMTPDQVPESWLDRTGELLLRRVKDAGKEVADAKDRTADARTSASSEGSSSSGNGGCLPVIVGGIGIAGLVSAGLVYGANRAMADTPSAASEINPPTATERSVTDPSVGLQPPTPLFDVKNLPSVAPRPNIVPLKH